MVRMITVKVENHKLFNRTDDDDLQFAARPDRLFTIAVRYLGELEAAAYDSETETKIETSTGDINRYVESDEGAVAVATVSVSGGTAPYSYNLVAGGLELGTDLTNMTVLIPASAVPSATPGLKLTARIEIDDTNRADTTPLNVDLTANYIMIPGHTDLVVVRDGETQAEDLNGETIYPLIVAAQSNSEVDALSGVDFKPGVSGQVLSRASGDAALVFNAGNKVVRVAADTPPNGNTLALVLKANDNDETTPQAKARSERLYTLQVRYMQELTAKPYDETSGGTEINAVREIRVTEAEADDAHFVARIDVEGGAGGNEIVVEGTNFEISGNELRIAADVTPGELATGNTLIATVKVNDDNSLVGGAETGEVVVLVTANYITLPPVEGSFVEGRDGITLTLSPFLLTVYSAWVAQGTTAPATIVATAKATVGTRTSDTFTFHKVGNGGPLEVDENSGAVMLAANRPDGNSNNQDYVITVEFRAAANAVHSQLTLTVKHQLIQRLTSDNNSFQSLASCHPGNQFNGNTLLTIVMAAGEEGSEWNGGGSCSYLAFSRDNRVYNVDEPRLPIARTDEKHRRLGIEDSERRNSASGAYCRRDWQLPHLHRFAPHFEHCDCLQQHRTGLACG